MAIVGSRPPSLRDSGSDDAYWRRMLDAYDGMLGKVRDLVRVLQPTSVIVSGDARGVDRCAQDFAKSIGMLTVECPISPKAWSLGKGIAAVRNRLVVDIAEEVYAFSFNHSVGTAMTIRMAEEAGKLTRVFEVNV